MTEKGHPRAERPRCRHFPEGAKVGAEGPRPKEPQSLKRGERQKKGEGLSARFGPQKKTKAVPPLSPRSLRWGKRERPPRKKSGSGMVHGKADAAPMGRRRGEKPKADQQLSPKNSPRRARGGRGEKWPTLKFTQENPGPAKSPD